MSKLTKMELLFVALAAVIVHLSSADDGNSPGTKSPGDGDPSAWPGHLKPLGWSTRHGHLAVAERNTFPTPLEFFQNYVYPSIPVIFKEGAKRSPAFHKWTDEYLKSLPESKDLIDVEQRKVEDRKVPPKAMPFTEFLDRYSVHDEYLVTGVPHFLRKDVLVPPSMHCDNITGNFFDALFFRRIPVIFKEGAKRSPAFHKWTDEYLKSLPESKDLIDVEQRKVEDRKVPPKAMPFTEFLDRYSVHDEYLVTGVPHFLRKDVLVPPSMHCDNITGNFFDAVMWFSSGGTKSVLHNDDVDNLNCLFSGRKEILFVNYTKYRHQILFDHPEGSYSGVNVEKVDFTKYPEFKDVEFFEATLEAGDCIYIPYKWYHQVNSIDRNIAVNIWWNHRANIIPIPSTCGNPNPGLSLADVKFHSEEVDKENEEENVHPEHEFLDSPAQAIAAYMEERGLVSFTEDDLVGYLSEKMPTLQGGIWNGEALDIGHEIFKLMDKDKDDQLTSEEIDNLMNQKEDESPSLLLQQQFMMLIDVVDEEVVKRREKLVRKLNKNETAEKTKTLPQDELKMSGGTAEPSSASKDEL